MGQRWKNPGASRKRKSRETSEAIRPGGAFFLIAGPCVLEDDRLNLGVAEELAGVSEALKRTAPRLSCHSAATSRCRTQRPPPSSSDPGTKVASGSQSVLAGAHIACGSGRTTRTGPYRSYLRP